MRHINKRLATVLEIPLFAVILISVFFSALLHSAFEPMISSPRSGAMGDAFTALSNDCSCVFANPAGIRQLPRFAAEFFMTNLYGLDTLKYNQAAIIMPTEKLGSFGLGYQALINTAGGGDVIYSESSLHITHGFYLGDGILFGYNLKRFSIKMKEYGESSVFALDSGILLKISPKLSIGMKGVNINTPSIGETAPENLPQSFTMGIALRPVTGLIFTAEGEKTVNYALNIKTGIDFRISKNLALRTGLQSNPARYSLGFGLIFGAFRFDYAYLNHPVLSGAHLFSASVNLARDSEIVYEWKERKVKKGRGKAKDEEENVQPEEKALPAGIIDINRASVEQLLSLPGMGKVTAERIIEYRNEKGAFKSPEDLLNVPRMTKRIYAKISAYIKTDIAPVSSGRDSAIQASNAKDAHSSAPEISKEESRTSDESESDISNDETDPYEGSLDEMTDINLADEDILIDSGLSVIISENIVRYRKKNGRIKDISELHNLPGMDARSFELIKSRYTIK